MTKIPFHQKCIRPELIRPCRACSNDTSSNPAYILITYLGNPASPWLPSPYLEYPAHFQSCRETGQKSDTIKGKAKRGRPPSKPPTEELIRKRRKVCYNISKGKHYIDHCLQAANAREKRRMVRMNEAFMRLIFLS